MKKRLLSLALCLALCLGLLPPTAWATEGEAEATPTEGSSKAVLDGDLEPQSEGDAPDSESCRHNNYDWTYTENDDDTHTVRCSGCGDEWDEDCFTESTLTGILPNGEAGHTLQCTCGREKTVAHIYEPLTYGPQVTLDGTGHSGNMCVCGYTESKDPHTYDEYGECTACRFKPVFEDSEGNLYNFGGSNSTAAINEAIENGITWFKLVNFAQGENADTTTADAVFSLKTNAAVTLDMNGKTLTHGAGEPTLIVSAGTLTVQGTAAIEQTGQGEETIKPAVKVTGGELIFEDDLTAIGGGSRSAAAPAIEVSGGKVTFEGKVTATGGLQGVTDNKMDCKPAIYATNGELDFQGDLDLNGGLTITGGAELTNKLSTGTFRVEYTKEGGTKKETVDGPRVSVVGSSNYSYVRDLLADNRVFANLDKNDANNKYFNGSFPSLGWNVTIEEHEHNYEADGDCHSCECGMSESHTYDSSGACSICGKPCPHAEATPSLKDYNYYCDKCGQQMFVLNTKGTRGSTDFQYAYFTNLKDAMAAADDGWTVKLLGDIDGIGYGIDIYEKNGGTQTITLDLNGRNITGSSPIWIGKLSRYPEPDIISATTLNIVGSGSISLGSYALVVSENSTLNLAGWTGGTINIVAVSSNGNTGNEGSLIVGTNDVHINNLFYHSWSLSTITKAKLYGGTYGNIEMTLTDYRSPGILFGTLLAPGYAFQYESGGFAKYAEKATYSDNGNLYNVKVVKCTAHADTDNDKYCDYCNTDLTSAAVASVATGGNTYFYIDLAAALKAVSDNGGTVKLLQNVENVTEPLKIDNEKSLNITLDLNGKTISGTSGSSNTFLSVSTYGTVTICDSSEAKTGKIECTQPGAYAVYVSAGKLIIEAGSFVGTDSQETIPTPGYALGVGAATLNITGGNFTGRVTVQNGIVNISGGTFTSLLTYDNTAIASLLADGYAFANSSTKAIQNGYNTSTLNNVTIVPHTHDWTVENENESSCACGLTCDHTNWNHDTGKCSVCEKQLYLARIGDKGYTALWGAISAASKNSTNEDTIYMLTDIDLGLHSLTISQGTFTLDLGGHQLTSAPTAQDPTLTFSSPANVTLKNGTVNNGTTWRAIKVLSGNVTLDTIVTSSKNTSSVSVNDGALVVKNSTLYGIKRENNNSGTVELHAGTKVLLYPVTAGAAFSAEFPGGINNMLASGCAFAKFNNGSTGNLIDGNVNNYNTSLIVIFHQHSFNTSNNKCACGVQAVASVEETYYTDLNEAISNATSGDTVKLLADASEVSISQTGIKLDANGKTITKLTATSPATLSGLLPEGYAYKSNGKWVSDLSASSLTNVTMAVPPIQGLSIAADNTSPTYGQSVTVTATATLGGEITGISYQWDCKDKNATVRTDDIGASWTLEKLDAGTYTFTCKATCDGYTVTSNEVTVTVGKASIEQANVTVSPLTYTGEAQSPKVTVTLNGNTLTANDYDISGNNETDAGNYQLTITGKGNYGGTVENVPWEIKPAELTLHVKPVAKTYDGNTDATVEVSFEGFKNDQQLTASDYTIEANYNDANAGDNKDITGKVTLNNTDIAKNYVLTNNGNFTTTGQIAKADQTITAENITATYGDTDKKVMASGIGTLTYAVKSCQDIAGQDAKVITVNETTGALTFRETGTATITVTAAGDENHNPATKDVTVTVATKKIIIRAKDKSAYVGSTAPDLSKPVLGTDYVIEGLVGEDNLSIDKIQLFYDLESGITTPDMTKPGTYSITIGIEYNSGGRYEAELAPGTLTITTRPSSGSSGSTGTKTDTVKNPDGSTTTTTETKADGSKTETTKGTTDGGSTGSTVTKTDSQGNTTTEAEVKVSDKDAKNAQETGQAVTAPVSVAPGQDANTAPVVKIDLGSNAGKGEVKVEIPVQDVSSGTVAVIVHPDGTEEIMKDSVPTDKGLEITLRETTTVKILDNSKTFDDTKDHWSRDEVNFVAARELFQGVGGNRFGVSEAMTRGMVNTVLARLNGVDTTPGQGQTWYEIGTDWAMKHGITDGTNPTANVTREQLATLLYRYAGSPAVSGSLTFADAASVSDYAKDALLWANQNGIVNGVGSNTIAPKANAERAQVAAMFARYLQNQ